MEIKIYSEILCGTVTVKDYTFKSGTTGVVILDNGYVQSEIKNVTTDDVLLNPEIVETAIRKMII